MSEEETKQVWDKLFQKLSEEEKTFLAIANNEKNKEIERLKQLCDRYEEEHKTVFEEWKKNINIINELEKYGKQRFNEYEAWKEECKNLCYINGITEMLDKLQELKGENHE